MKRIYGWRVIVAAGGLLLAGQLPAASTSNGAGVNRLTTHASGVAWTCAIDSDREVVCADGFWDTGTRVGVRDAVNISASWVKTCAVTRFGEVYCWEPYETPVKQEGFGTGAKFAVSVVVLAPMAAQDSSQCVLVNNGKVYCWGANEDGQLGDGTTTDRTSPVEVKGVSGVVALSSGSTGSAPLTCAIRYTGGVRCWGGTNMHTAIAVTNGDYVREIAITMDGLCLWRRHESMSRVECVRPTAEKIANIANYTRMSFVYPQALTGSAYGGVCAKDSNQTSGWYCFDSFYGLTQTPGAGYMSSLPFQASLAFGDASHSCAEFSDRSLRCMVHGWLVPPCDLAKFGADCIDNTGSTQPPGTWEMVPNLILAESKQPTIGAASDGRLDACSKNTLSVSWKPHASSTGHRLFACVPGSCRAVSPTVTEDNGRLKAKIAGLSPNTAYTIRIDGYNWASLQTGVDIEGRTLPQP